MIGEVERLFGTQARVIERAFMRSLTLIIFLLVGCGDSGGSDSIGSDAGALGAQAGTGATGSAAIAGDWFPCLGEGCPQLNPVGTRYTAEGTVFQISAPRPASIDAPRTPFLPGDPYCVSSPELGRWTYDAASDRITVVYSLSSAPPSVVPPPAEPVYVRMDPQNATGTWTSSNCVVD